MDHFISFLGEVLLLLVLATTVVIFSKSAFLQRFGLQKSEKASKPAEDASKTPGLHSEAVNEGAFKLPPLKPGASSHMTMGLRTFDSLNWLTVDENYLLEHNIRSRLLSDHTSSVLQCLPGSESACHEALSVVASFLTIRYPSMFRFSGSGQGKHIHNLHTGESFQVADNPRPLEVAARLAMEDFNLLVKDPINGEYSLQASATLFPAGWKLEDRIGSTLTDLHCPVPAWKNKLGPNVNHFFDRLLVSPPSKSMERHTLFVQTTPGLFQDDSLCASSSTLNHTIDDAPLILAQNKDDNETHSFDLSYVPDQKNSQDSNGNDDFNICALSDIYIRRERQTFTRLPSSNAILFTVRTFMTPLTSLADEELTAFVEQARGWGSEMASYKGREKWWGTVLQYQTERQRGLSTGGP